ncbi:uncharacterized protein ATC70_005809 [Mucor velutinosus]|uniref:Peptidase M20 domain-containing protein 2 n=1 Tax=Mucor velutinosus TaxID=708070 RepID=A0AAN7HYR9_9FUNG|nr:hypothetical protein ATC70_005809 [Mucor velutinosus]
MSNSIKQSIESTIESIDKELRDISLKIHENPELGDQEFNACKILSDYMEEKGFQVTREVAGLKTSFLAIFSNNESGRRVGFASEYDALPGIGHACGHNLIAIQGVACAVSMKALMDNNLVQGTVVLFGTPAEESSSGKINFVKEGLIKNNVDVALMLHPMAQDMLYGRLLALDNVKIEYFGKPAHASTAPWEGVNALDAMVQAITSLGLMRQQILPTDRVHGIITNGGEAPNVIPSYVSASYYVRSLTKNQLESLKTRVEQCFKGAAYASGCEVKMKWHDIGSIDDVFMNDTMAANFKSYMEKEGITYKDRTEEEQLVVASTDFGNVSYTVPSIHPMYAIHTDAGNHTKEFTDASKTEIAHKDTLRASKCLVMTAADVLTDDNLYKQVVADFKKGKPQ